MTLLEMTVSAGLMILIITVIRAIAIDRLPKRLFVTLWGVVLLRLLIPLAVPFHLSLFSLAQDSAYSSNPSAVFTHNGKLVREARLSVQSVQSNHISSVDIWTVLWLIGIIIAALFFVFAYLWNIRRFRAAKTVDNAFTNNWLASHPLLRTISIRESSKVTAPLTYGIFRPVIIVPVGMDWEDTDTLNYAFSHEYIHIRRFDALLRVLLVAALCAHWFNPLVWVMYILALRDIELSCDERVVREFGLESRRAYALSLLKMEETRRYINAFASGFSKNAANERLRAIMKLRRTSALRAVVSAFLVMCSLLAFCTDAAAIDVLVESPDLIRTPAEEITKSCGDKSHLIQMQEGDFIKLMVVGKGEGVFGFFLCSDAADEAVGKWIALDGSRHIIWFEAPAKGDYYLCVSRDYQRNFDASDSYTYTINYTGYASDGKRADRWNRGGFDGSCKTSYSYIPDNVHPEYDNRF